MGQHLAMSKLFHWFQWCTDRINFCRIQPTIASSSVSWCLDCSHQKVAQIECSSIHKLSWTWKTSIWGECWIVLFSLMSQAYVQKDYFEWRRFNKEGPTCYFTAQAQLYYPGKNWAKPALGQLSRRWTYELPFILKFFFRSDIVWVIWLHWYLAIVVQQR